MGYTAQEWLRDPKTLYHAINGVVMRDVAKFNAVQRSLPIMEKQALALRIMARELRSSGLDAEATARMSDVSALRGQVEKTKFAVNELLQKLITIRTWIQSLPGGGSFLGGPEALAVPGAAITIAVAVAYVGTLIYKTLQLHDGTGRALQASLNRISDLEKQGKITHEQAAKARAKAIENGGVPDPSAVPAIAGAFSGGIVIALAAFFLLNRKKTA
jgi:hypothetical protein